MRNSLFCESLLAEIAEVHSLKGGGRDGLWELRRSDRGEEAEMRPSPRIVIENVSLTGPDGKKYARKLKEDESFSEAYWSLALEAHGIRAARGKSEGRRAKRKGERSR